MVEADHKKVILFDLSKEFSAQRGDQPLNDKKQIFIKHHTPKYFKKNSQ